MLQSQLKVRFCLYILYLLAAIILVHCLVQALLLLCGVSHCIVLLAGTHSVHAL
jgi:hypothetical protein